MLFRAALYHWPLDPWLAVITSRAGVQNADIELAPAIAVLTPKAELRIVDQGVRWNTMEPLQ